MSTISLEEAQRCPRCSMPGEETQVMPHPERPRIKVHIVFCRNERCKWHNTSWVIQENPDGTIPVRKAGQKEFVPMSPGAESMARAYLEQTEEDLKRKEVDK